MSIVQEILQFNQKFVENKEYEKYVTDKFPDKKMVILTCMDTRLSVLLPQALNLKNGDAKIVKNAGAIVSHPFGSIMRSIIVAIYELNASEVLVIGHYDCGMTGLNSESLLEKARARGVSQKIITTLDNAGIDLESWLTGFDHARDGVEHSVELIRNHPLLPEGIKVHGLIIDPSTGRLDLVDEQKE